MIFTWQRFGGYEVSSQGDKRFSAFYALMPDGRTLEQHYQCDVKGYDPGGRNWKLGKGKPPLNKSIDLFARYVDLWEIWAMSHAAEMKELQIITARHHEGVLSDRFATTSVNQAHALATLLNEKSW